MKIVCLIFILSILKIPLVHGQQSIAEASIADSQVRNIYSRVVNQDYQLLIKLPMGYKQSQKVYPVIYFLDAQWDFPLMVSTYGQSYYDGFIPEAILVGIQWGGNNPDPNILRARDFTPTNIQQISNSGGANKFLEFIKQELIPFIGEEYRVNNTRILMGSSYGGLFTLYTLFHQPNLFNGYIPTASASGWDNNKLYEYAKNFADKKLLHPIQLYSAIGEYDDLVPAFDELANFFDQYSFENLSVKFEKLSGLGHASLKGAGNTYGLHYVFAQPNLELTKQHLVEFAGKYQNKSKTKALKIHIENQKLALNMDGSNHVLSASSQHSFYRQGRYLKLKFDNAAKPQKLTLETFMNVEVFLKED